MINYKQGFVHIPSTGKNSSHLPLASNVECCVIAVPPPPPAPLHSCLGSSNQPSCASPRGSPENAHGNKLQHPHMGLAHQLQAMLNYETLLCTQLWLPAATGLSSPATPWEGMETASGGQWCQGMGRGDLTAYCLLFPQMFYTVQPTLALCSAYCSIG